MKQHDRKAGLRKDFDATDKIATSILISHQMLMPCQRIFAGGDGGISAAGHRKPRQNARRHGKKRRVFRRLRKPPRAISFVLDRTGKKRSRAINPPIEGRIPDAI
jgi:hypothetical protein